MYLCNKCKGLSDDLMKDIIIEIKESMPNAWTNDKTEGRARGLCQAVTIVEEKIKMITNANKVLKYIRENG